MVVLSLLSVLALSWPPVADALVRSLERHPAVAPQQLPQAKVQAIVVLGGGADTVAPEYGVDVLSRGARERVRYAVYLQQQTGLPILATGGSTGGMRAEALVMKDVVEREFKGRVRWTEVESLDTRSNAEKSAVQLKAAGIERIALVTHAWHMVRATRDFERAGLQVLGYASQAWFLLNLGLAERMAAASLAERSQAQRLINEHEMGELFKVIGFSTSANWAAQGFARGDRSHRL